MRIINYKTKGYKNFALCDWNEASFNFVNNLILLLGRNGSGKSSLFRRLIPSIISKKNFNEEGYEEITILHNNFTYILRHDDKGKCLFVKDDIVLNDYGTSVIQKELIEKEFNLTKEVHSIITNRFKFTSMDPKLTMKLLTEASRLDFNYAFTLYHRASNDLKESKSVLKHVNTKLEGALSRKEEVNEIEELKSKGAVIRGQISTLNTLIAQSPNMPLESLWLALSQHCDEIRRKLQKGYSSGFYDPLNAILNVKSIYELRDLKELKEKELFSTESQLKELYKKEYELKQTLDKTSNISKEEILLEKSNLESKLGNTPLYTSNEITSLKRKLNIFIQYYNRILLSEKENNVKCREFDREELEAVIDKAYHLQCSKEKLTKRLETVISRKEKAELNKEHKLNCTNCNHTNFYGDSLSDQDLILLDKEITSIQKEIEIIDDKHSVMFTSGIGSESIVANIANETINDLLREIGGDFIKLVFKDYHTLYDTNLTEDLRIQFERKLELEEERIEIKNRLSNIDQILVILENSTSNKDLYISNSNLIHELESNKYNLEFLLNNINSNITKYELKQDAVNFVEGINKEIKSIKETIFKVKCGDIAKDRLYKLESELGEINKRINQFNEAENVIQSLKKEQIEFETKVKALTVLVDNLSPKTGIIGSQMQMFFDGFFDEVNEILASIFDTDLKITCNDPNKEGVNYKFNLVLNGEIAGLIEEASEGQKDVIDLAFKIVYLRHMDLDEYPLLLDEVEQNFDEHHRTRYFEFIKNYIYENPNQQILVISHYNDIYGGLNHYDSIVLKEDNLTVPDNSNEHVYFD